MRGARLGGTCLFVQVSFLLLVKVIELIRSCSPGCFVAIVVALAVALVFIVAVVLVADADAEDVCCSFTSMLANPRGAS